MVKRTGARATREAAPTGAALVPLERIDRCIYEMRGQRVMLDTDLAEFYGVPTKVFNQAIKRNLARFPSDFMFQLDQTEYELLRSQIVTSKPVQGGRRYLPYAFTEHGAIMAASVLNSGRAVQMSVLVVRAFVRLRQILVDHRDLARRIEALERQFIQKTAEHEAHIHKIYEILHELMSPPEPPKKARIGFVSDAITGAAPRPPRVGSRTTAKFVKRLSGAHR
jgi:hypothetical protein